MARKSKTGVLKRLREVKKAEKAALKRDQKEIRRQNVGEAERVATKDDLEGYGFTPDADEEEAADAPPARSRGLRALFIARDLVRSDAEASRAPAAGLLRAGDRPLVA